MSLNLTIWLANTCWHPRFSYLAPQKWLSLWLFLSHLALFSFLKNLSSFRVYRFFPSFSDRRKLLLLTISWLNVSSSHLSIKKKPHTPRLPQQFILFLRISISHYMIVCLFVYAFIFLSSFSSHNNVCFIRTGNSTSFFDVLLLVPRPGSRPKLSSINSKVTSYIFALNISHVYSE